MHNTCTTAIKMLIPQTAQHCLVFSPWSTCTPAPPPGYAYACDLSAEAAAATDALRSLAN